MKNYLKHTSLSAQFRRFGSAGLVLSLFSSPLFAASINVAWDPSSSSNVGGYKVSWGTSSGNYTSTVDVGNKTAYTLPGLTEGTKYFVAAKAYDSTKTTESAYSNEANVTVPVTTTTSTGGTTTSTGGTTTSTGGTTTSTGGTTTSGTGTATSNGLVAAYGFEETSGTTVTDASGKANNATIKEAVRIDTGKYGKALKFDGINDWVTVNDSASLALSTGMTLEAWVYPTAMTDNATVILKEANNAEVYALYADEDASLPVSYINNGSYRAVTGPNKLPVNQWSHLVSTYDGQYQRLYVNGTEVAKSAQNGQIQQSSGALRIGGNSVWGEYFTGYIDEVRIYNRALTATEVGNNSKTAVSTSSTTNTTSTTSSQLQLIMGNKTEEPWVDYQIMGRAEAYQVVAAKSGSVTEVQVYLDAGTTTATKLVAGVYTENNGHAGTLVTQGTLSTLKSGWNRVAIPSAAVTAGRKYWFAVLGVDGGIGFLDRVGSGTGIMEKSSSRYLTSLPATWTASSYNYSINSSMSIYGNGN